MKHMITKLAAATALVSVLAALPASADEPKRGGTLIAAVGNNPRHLNPAVQSGIVTGFPGAQLFAAGRSAMTRTGRPSPISPNPEVFRMTV